MIIPFFIPHSGCPHQCVFCNQKNITGRSNPVDPSSIPQTVKEYLATNTADTPVQVAFYGGSFTALPREAQKAYFEAVRPLIASGHIEGIRLSTRPDRITEEILSFLKEYHVSIIELGAQSMDDDVLSLSGRGHSSMETVNAVHLLRRSGFAVGLQLMPGLPGDSAGRFKMTVEKTIDLRPDFVRIYPALVIKDTPMELSYRTGRYTPLGLDEAVSLCCDALVMFERADIAVIRIGLQPSEELERPGTVIAGPYHPAFRQLVESSLLLDAMRAALLQGSGDSAVTFRVNSGKVSTAIGQKRANVIALAREFNLTRVAVVADPRVHKRAVRVEPGFHEERNLV